MPKEATKNALGYDDSTTHLLPTMSFHFQVGSRTAFHPG